MLRDLLVYLLRPTSKNAYVLIWRLSKKLNRADIKDARGFFIDLDDTCEFEREKAYRLRADVASNARIKAYHESMRRKPNEAQNTEAEATTAEETQAQKEGSWTGE